MDRAVPHRPGNIEAFGDTLNYDLSIDNFPERQETTMRKPRDYDAELKALEDKAKELKARKVQ
jgi:hypothetical protein